MKEEDAEIGSKRGKKTMDPGTTSNLKEPQQPAEKTLNCEVPLEAGFWHLIHNYSCKAHPCIIYCIQYQFYKITLFCSTTYNITTGLEG